MRGHDEQTHHMFSYLSPEQRVPADHPLRAVRALTDHALKTMSRRFAGLYAKTGRPSIPPEQLLRALLLQVRWSNPRDGDRRTRGGGTSRRPLGRLRGGSLNESLQNGGGSWRRAYTASESGRLQCCSVLRQGTGFSGRRPPYRHGRSRCTR